MSSRTNQFKLQEVVTFLESKINEECSITTSDYCQLELYTRDKQIAQVEDFNYESFFFIVDVSTRLTLGTISSSLDESDHCWVMVNGAKFKGKQKKFIQSTLFNQNLDKVHELSNSLFTIQDSDCNYYITKTNAVINKIQLDRPYTFLLLTAMLISITLSYWLPIQSLGFDKFFFVTPLINIIFFIGIIFGHSEEY